MNREQANMFFQVIVALYEKGSLIVTNNLPFEQEGATFAHNTTLMTVFLDRLLHHVHILFLSIAGESYRLKYQRQLVIPHKKKILKMGDYHLTEVLPSGVVQTGNRRGQRRLSACVKSQCVLAMGTYQFNRC